MEHYCFRCGHTREIFTDTKLCTECTENWIMCRRASDTRDLGTRFT